MSYPKPPYENGFYMAVIGDNDGVAEPVRIEDGFWYSTGCADPHSLASIFVVSEITTKTDTRKEMSAWEADQEWRARDFDGWAKAFQKRTGREPSYRRWPNTGGGA